MGSFKDSKYGDLSQQDITMASLNLAGRDIDSLEGSPEIFRGTFALGTNDLKDLTGSPKEIYGDAIFADNLLESLKGNLKTVIGNLNLSDNMLEDFEGDLRKVTGNLIVEKLDFFKERDTIEQAIMQANIIVGGDIMTDFGIFKQDAQKIADFSKNQRIGILQKFL